MTGDAAEVLMHPQKHFIPIIIRHCITDSLTD